MTSKTTRGETKATVNHDTIKQWCKARAGLPAVVRGTQSEQGGMLRISFPRYDRQESLEEISWERFLQIFDDSKLAFVYQTELEDGSTSRFCKLVYASTVEELLKPDLGDTYYQSHVTCAHEKIRRWIEIRGGHPAVVTSTKDDDRGGILAVDFGKADDSTSEGLTALSWESFFEIFEKNDIAFLYQEKTKDGRESRFCKFVANA